MLAGINAALQAQQKEAWHPRRDEAYLGVLVDDLITLGTQEPYRMFTSRAEYRLLLRQDNADLRLTEKARELGLIDDARWARFNNKCEAVIQEQQRLQETWVQPGTPEAQIMADKLGSTLGHEYSLMALLKRPELNYEDIKNLKGDGVKDEEVAEQVVTQAKYEGYINRQKDEIERLRRHEMTRLPAEFVYDDIPGLSNEVKQKLNELRPETLAAAARIPGVTPAAVSLLLIHLKKRDAVMVKSA